MGNRNLQKELRLTDAVQPGNIPRSLGSPSTAGEGDNSNEESTRNLRPVRVSA